MLCRAVFVTGLCHRLWVRLAHTIIRYGLRQPTYAKYGDALMLWRVEIQLNSLPTAQPRALTRSRVREYAYSGRLAGD
jgi:hypothetical protein